MKERLTNIHFEIIRNSICTSREIADSVGDFILRCTTDSEFAEVAVALMKDDKDEVFTLMKKILNEAIWYLATIVVGLEISISALVQSINGLMKREEKLLENGQNARAREVRSVIERLYVLRNELILVLNRQKQEKTELT